MQKLFKKSLELSRALYPADFGERRCAHWSFLYSKNRLLVVGENKQKSHPRNRFNVKDFDVALKNCCSELICFVKAKNKFENLNWKKLTMVNVRIDKRGNIKNSRCCPACQNLIKYLGIQEVYHTTDAGTFEQFVTE